MGGPPNSQAVALPTNLPFRIVSKTIGSGAYASIRKATPLNASGPVIAVKFINKDHAYKTGRLSPKQLRIEASIHNHVSKHSNIITMFDWGQDEAWVWMCMELAEGGDLFDKIEADEGVGEDVAHFYFSQLVGAIDWCHNHGVAHRDIKPENMLLSAAGDLRLADFGLATQFFVPNKDDSRKTCGMVCGSPPYIAPEILAVGSANAKRKSGEDKAGYDPQGADVWSCAIVLFVLLVGNTPWDSPVAEESYEYYTYVRTNGRPTDNANADADDDDLWAAIPPASLSLLRGMLNITPAERFTLDHVRKHPWFTRANPHLNSKGMAANPVHLATQMLEALHIDFAAPVRSSQSQRRRGGSDARAGDPDAMDVDDAQTHHAFASTQPETPVADLAFDWEAPPRVGHSAGAAVSASQPTAGTNTLAGAATRLGNNNSSSSINILDLFADDPSMSQFAATPAVPLTLTQAARRFADVVPAHSLARFVSALPFAQLLPMLGAALHRLSVPVPTPSAPQLAGREPAVSWRVKTLDARGQPLQGSVVVERIAVPGQVGLDVLEVRFVKAKGDPVGWRRLFKQVAVLCKDGVVIPH